jgi:hypothetical protein
LEQLSGSIPKICPTLESGKEAIFSLLTGDAMDDDTVLKDLARHDRAVIIACATVIALLGWAS